MISARDIWGQVKISILVMIAPAKNIVFKVIEAEKEYPLQSFVKGERSLLRIVTRCEISFVYKEDGSARTLSELSAYERH